MTDRDNDTETAAGRETQSLQTFSILMLVLGILFNGLFLCASLFAGGAALRRRPTTASLGTAVMVIALLFAATTVCYRLGAQLAVRDNAITAAHSAH